MGTMVAQNMWFAVEQNEDPDVRSYHSRLRLLEDYATVQAFANMRQIADAYGNLVDLTGVPRLLLEIRGVSWVNVTAYQIVLRKSPVVDWAEIERDVLQLLYGVKQAVCLPVFAVTSDGESVVSTE